ncbi:MAG: S8 family serine peptidase [Lachnospiraceae bacterium]|nr:S8 family serine peptidase [Lachnospiraceae bacterium]
MKRRKVLAMLMTAVMTFTSVAPQTALVANAEDGEEDVVVEELPFDLKGMPDGYTLSEEQLEMKAAMKEHDVLGTFAGLTEGVDYEEGTVIFLAETEEEAQAVAEAYNSELVRFEYGVAVAKLPETLTVEQALTVAEDPAYLMPVVAPNYISYLIDDADESVEDFDLGEFESETMAATEAHKSAWESFVQGGKLANPDPYIKNPAISEYQWMHDMIGTYEAWGANMGKAEITVAVLDTGVLPDHPDLKGRVTQVPVSDIPVTLYTSDHGTHVAGIIGASAGNGQGGAGIAPNVSIRSYGVFRYFGTGSNKSAGSDDADWLIALGDCAANKVPIANMSLGGPSYSPVTQQKIKQIANQGVNIIVAMGNDGSNLKSYPACYDGVISVSSINPSGKASSFTTYGKDADICAPGSHIMSCDNPKADDYKKENADSTGYYTIMSGTSMATPVVAGVCALYMSQYGVQKPADMLKILQKNANKTSSKQIGKIVNVSKMFASGAKAKAKSDDNKVFTFDIEGADEGAYVVYTTDGTEPALVDGQIFNGKVFEGAVEFDQTQSVVVVKSIVVTASGEIGDVETASFAVSDKNEGEIVGAKAAPIAVSGDNNRVANNSARIYTTNVAQTAFDDTQITLTAPSSVKWSVSKKDAKVVEVVTAEGNSTVIKAIKTGKATVNAVAADGSKAKVKIEVIVPASSINITPDGNAGGDSAGQIAIGKSKTVELVLGNTYGTPSVKNVEWDFQLPNGKTEAAKNSKAVKISNKGKLSINKKNWAKAGLPSETSILVTAKTTDGTNLSATAVYQVWEPAKEFTSCILNANTGMIGNIGAKNIRITGNWYNNDSGTYRMYMGVITDKKITRKTDITITSSNPSFAGAKFAGMDTYNGKYVYFYYVFAGEKSKGKAKITLTLNDGSKKKAAITFSH